VLWERAYALASRANVGPLLLVVDLASQAVSEVALAPLGIAHAAELTAAAGRLWLTARAADETGRSLWVSDGTPAGTQRLAATLAPRPSGETESPLVTALDDVVYFIAGDAVHGRELWRSDGTGTALVADLAPGLASGAPRSDIVAWGGRLYFAADDGVHGEELWSSNGTAAGTRLETDLAAGPTGSSPTDLTVAGDHLFFVADDGVSGWQLWVMDPATP
jgi:ELWxxDGT repeat protein